jgi:hypothetical protein
MKALSREVDFRKFLSGKVLVQDLSRAFPGA